MGKTITEEQISIYLNRMQSILDYCKMVCTEAYAITLKWYSLYEQNYKWYWGFKLSYSKFIDKLSEYFYFKIIVSYLGYNMIALKNSTETCDELDVKTLMKYTKLTDIELYKDVEKVLKAINLVQKHKSFIYKVNDSKLDIIRFNIRYKFDLNYDHLMISCEEFIQKNNIKII